MADIITIGSYAGLGVAVIETVRFLASIIVNRPSAELRLTDDVYFRLGPLGETMFNNFTLINRGSLLELRKLRLVVEKFGGRNKSSLDFAIKYIGEKSGQIENLNIKDNLFESTSVAEFLPKDTLIKKVIMSSSEEYSEQIQEVFNRFFTDCDDLLKIKLSQPDGGSSNEDQQQIITRALDIVNQYKGQILPLIKLENAKYIITLTAECRPTSGFWRLILKNSNGNLVKKSQITLELKDIESYHKSLETYLLDSVFKRLGIDRGANCPTIFPRNIQEKEI